MWPVKSNKKVAKLYRQPLENLQRASYSRQGLLILRAGAVRVKTRYFHNLHSVCVCVCVRVRACVRWRISFGICNVRIYGSQRTLPTYSARRRCTYPEVWIHKLIPLGTRKRSRLLEAAACKSESECLVGAHTLQIVRGTGAIIGTARAIPPSLLHC